MTDQPLLATAPPAPVAEQKTPGSDFGARYARFSWAYTFVLLAASGLMLALLSEQQLASYGQFLGAIATALTLCWMVAGFWLQRRELHAQLAENKLQREALQATRDAHKQMIALTLAEKQIAMLENVSKKIYEAAYLEKKTTGVDTGELPHMSELLARADLEDTLKDRYASGNILPAIHCADYLSRCNIFAEIISILPRPIYSGHMAFHLARRIRSTLGELNDPNDGSSRSWWE